MTVTLELKPETESRVSARAKSYGKTVENFLVEFIEDNFYGESKEKSFYETASDDEWIAELDSLAMFSDKIPVSFDDRRESIYGERENLQI